jgi:hypothetical protein
MPVAVMTMVRVLLVQLLFDYYYYQLDYVWMPYRHHSQQ